MIKPFDDAVAASRAVLIEAMGVLGRLHSHLVIIGGWVPELQIPGKGHPGSLDVDLAVDTRSLPPGPYSTIRRCLVDAGYQQGNMPSVFLRQIPGTSGPFQVKLDLVCAELATAMEPETGLRVQDLMIHPLRGIGIALDSCDEVRIDGERPDGASDAVVARIATLEAFVCMKAFAMAERRKPKDAYDVYFCLRHRNLDQLSTAINLISSQSIVREAIDVLADKFRTINHAGPIDAATVAQEHGDDYEQSRRGAFELMQLLLERIKNV